MNFWSLFTRPGDKHDEGISNWSSSPQLTILSILPLVSRFQFNFSHDKTLNLMVIKEYHSEMNCFFGWIKRELFTVAESLLILLRELQAVQPQVTQALR